jgi:CxxC-x17-CxxC domain-containing protein
MHQGNWTCSGCGAAINELPFEPRSTDGLLCRECHQKKRAENAPKERQSFSGQWSCSGCGTAINELPFEPRNTSNLLCKACFRNKQSA